MDVFHGWVFLVFGYGVVLLLEPNRQLILEVTLVHTRPKYLLVILFVPCMHCLNYIRRLLYILTSLFS